MTEVDWDKLTLVLEKIELQLQELNRNVKQQTFYIQQLEGALRKH